MEILQKRTCSAFVTKARFMVSTSIGTNSCTSVSIAIHQFANQMANQSSMFIPCCTSVLFSLTMASLRPNSADVLVSLILTFSLLVVFGPTRTCQSKRSSQYSMRSYWASSCMPLIVFGSPRPSWIELMLFIACAYAESSGFLIRFTAGYQITMCSNKPNLFLWVWLWWSVN